MKKLVSLLLIAVMLSASFLTIPVMADTAVDYFAVSFDTNMNKFVVTATAELAGTNRVLLLVQDGSNTIYMDAVNAVAAQDVYFTVDLGDALEMKEYTFIVSSDGDTTATQTLTCQSETVAPPEFFTVTLDEENKCFKVDSVEGKYTGTNRVILSVYKPFFNGYQEIWYMDAVNEAKSFNFTVPIPDMAPIGSYTFRVAVYGDMMKEGALGCEYSSGFTSYEEAVEGSTDVKMGGMYPVTGEETETVAVFVALYKKGENGADIMVKASVNNVADDGYIKADVTLTAAEQTTDYYVRVFAWKQATVNPLASSITINQE